ncbi:Activin receptor type-1 [Sarcoptes scabiei]|uniref:receptor protein serine/threonine kinase n=2 Tax=Sarcoptes scabiei TaxID=52283 RepID=A0A834R8A3_SARSC|nr:Activin receptor type-1 [Sarcoptes scabiei]
MLEKIKCHFCQGNDCIENDFRRNQTVSDFCLSKTGKCFVSVDLTNQEATHQRGCIDNDLICILNGTQHISNQIDTYLKCCHTDFCNDEEFVKLDLSRSAFLEFISLIVIVFSSLLILFLMAYSMRKLSPRHRYLSSSITDRSNHKNDDFAERKLFLIDNNKDCNNMKPDANHLTAQFTCDNLKESYDESQTSGSGSGLTKMIERTFAKRISLIECVGKGRYGEVWKGIFNYEDVAVKIFFSRDEASFQREIEIYSNHLHKHRNILAFIGSDVTSKNSCTQLWLVTAYHEFGSLFDYLNAYTICVEDLFSIMISIVSGIEYLHGENFGTRKKCPIAHRDIKSKNILMKNRSVCCIADFGLAVTEQKTGKLNIAYNYRVGTKRYMAPEVLDGSFNDKSFDSYIKADIYSLSLVFWEIIRRFQSNDHRACQYEVPYQHKVPSDPSFDDMKKVVCFEQFRPEIPYEIQTNPLLSSTCKLIRETWSKNPSSRLNALRIKKTLISLNSTDQTLPLMPLSTSTAV